MPIDVVMPQMGESITEGTLTKWLKRTGDTVARDEPLFEISTDKVDAEIPSPAAGTLGEIKVQEGATVGVGIVVCAINDSGAADSTPAVASPKESSATGEKRLLQQRWPLQPAIRLFRLPLPRYPALEPKC